MRAPVAADASPCAGAGPGGGLQAAELRLDDERGPPRGLDRGPDLLGLVRQGEHAPAAARPRELRPVRVGARGLDELVEEGMPDAEEVQQLVVPVHQLPRADEVPPPERAEPAEGGLAPLRAP